MVLLAGFKAWLYRYTGQNDLLVGTPVAGRSHGQSEKLIGFFVNTLVLRTGADADPSFLQLLGRVRETCLQAYGHQDVPFEKLVEELHPQRDLSYAPLFQVMFMLQNAPAAALELAGLKVKPLQVHSQVAKFDLSLSFSEEPGPHGNHLLGWAEYSTDLFEPSTIERMVGHFTRLLEGIVEDGQRRIHELPMLSASEHRQILIEWNTPSPEVQARAEQQPPVAATLHQMFEAFVHARPQAEAVVCADQRLSYPPTLCLGRTLSLA